VKDFIATQDQVLLHRHGLADFDALWALELAPVDEPNTSRGGWSSVYRLQLGDTAFYLKRQSDYLTRSLRRPFGEPTFAREFRNIERYRALGIPALQAAFFGERRVRGEHRAILLTRALDDWQDLDHWLQGWVHHPAGQRQAIGQACGELARGLHRAGQVHGCFYPKHIFLRAQGERFEACLIDLEKTRPIWLGQRDRVKDLEPLLRRTTVWSDAEVLAFLGAYLGEPSEAGHWFEQLTRRRRNKEARA